MSLAGDLNDPVTQSFRQLPLDEGIRRLTRGHSLTLVYTQSRGLAPPALATVHVYPGPWNRAGRRAARLRALATLTDRGGLPAIGGLASMLRGDHDPVVRSQAAVALGRLGGPRAVAALGAALDDPTPSVRCHAVTALLGVQREAATRTLRGVLEGDPDATIRRTAARALGSLRVASARRALVAAGSDPDESVRQEVARILKCVEGDERAPEAHRLNGAPRSHAGSDRCSH
jgi:hypothetical protein